MIASCDSKRDETVFRISYWFGLRASEVGLLQRDDYDADAGTIFVHRLKGSLSHSYQLPPELDRLLDSYVGTRDDDHPALFLSRNGNGISRKQLAVLMKKYGGKAKLPPEKCNFHVLRHSIGLHLVWSGISPERVGYHLGHSSFQSIRPYLETDKTDVFISLPDDDIGNPMDAIEYHFSEMSRHLSNVDIGELPFLTIDGFESLTGLPKISCVYFVVCPTTHNVLYIGKATNLRGRWSPNTNVHGDVIDVHSGFYLAAEMKARLYWWDMPKKMIATIEGILIRKMNPKWNKVKF